MRGPWERLVLAVVLWLLVGGSAQAQYRFDVWTTDNGLPQNGVRAIAQTPDGYLWFTTFDGLVRFDGVHFTTFSTGNTKGIINDRFSGLYGAKDGTLYATTTENGVLTVYRQGRVHVRAAACWKCRVAPRRARRPAIKAEEGEYREYSTDEQRRAPGCIARRHEWRGRSPEPLCGRCAKARRQMPWHFQHGLLNRGAGARPLHPADGAGRRRRGALPGRGRRTRSVSCAVHRVGKGTTRASPRRRRAAAGRNQAAALSPRSGSRYASARGTQWRE